MRKYLKLNRKRSICLLVLWTTSKTIARLRIQLLTINTLNAIPKNLILDLTSTYSISLLTVKSLNYPTRRETLPTPCRVKVKLIPISLKTKMHLLRIMMKILIIRNAKWRNRGQRPLVSVIGRGKIDKIRE